MFIQCDCSVDPDFTFEAWWEGTTVANEPQKCCECRAEIPVGARYWFGSGISPEDLGDDELDEDGEPNEAAEQYRQHFVRCMGCHYIAERLCSMGSILGGLVEQVSECLGFNYTEDPEEWDQEEVDEEDAEHREDVHIARLVAERSGR